MTVLLKTFFLKQLDFPHMHWQRVRGSKILFLVLFIIARHFSLSAVDHDTILNIGDFPADPPPETHALWSLQGEFVQVRGFWYPVSSDQGVLASHPGLKSCCLAAPAKLRQQLIVKGQLASLAPQRVVTLGGIFKIDPLYNREGELLQFYVLEQAREVHQEASYLPYLILGLFLALLVLWLFFLRRRQAN